MTWIITGLFIVMAYFAWSNGRTEWRWMKAIALLAVYKLEPEARVLTVYHLLEQATGNELILVRIHSVLLQLEQEGLISGFAANVHGRGLVQHFKLTEKGHDKLNG